MFMNDIVLIYELISISIFNNIKYFCNFKHEQSIWRLKCSDLVPVLLLLLSDYYCYSIIIIIIVYQYSLIRSK